MLCSCRSLKILGAEYSAAAGALKVSGAECSAAALKVSGAECSAAAGLFNL